MRNFTAGMHFVLVNIHEISTPYLKWIRAKVQTDLEQIQNAFAASGKLPIQHASAKTSVKCKGHQLQFRMLARGLMECKVPSLGSWMKDKFEAVSEYPPKFRKYHKILQMVLGNFKRFRTQALRFLVVTLRQFLWVKVQNPLGWAVLFQVANSDIFSYE